MTALLDSNAVVALVVADHEHHARASEWFAAVDTSIATCPITQGTLLRFLLRSGVATAHACQVLDALLAHPRHEFWPDSQPYSADLMAGVIGHRQVTDAYLAGLARSRAATLATFDRGLAALHPDVAILL